MLSSISFSVYIESHISKSVFNCTWPRRDRLSTLLNYIVLYAYYNKTAIKRIDKRSDSSHGILQRFHIFPIPLGHIAWPGWCSEEN